MTQTIPPGVDGEQLHAARRQRRLSIPQLAEAAKRSQWHLYKVERSVRAFTWPVYVDVCRALDIPVGAELTYEGPRRFGDPRESVDDTAPTVTNRDPECKT
ncbi:helix-turn-helix domain-containing protein [Nocardiopsis exhalans]|uniref:Helix-turn-helix domain-containing protein n=1 Tax=Nocardiopsis exhalans TaxID=163604 RepID=A0ABY5DEL2_9ACTN|nr:helix-turn-helix transcriptional regulator [Nocardiopsis exhalans]USY21805.1 helix-turn-helix domain-containing protein [Nocardiopsis exhalans]